MKKEKGKQYAAHIDKEGRVQSIKDHLEGTAELAGAFAGVFGFGQAGRTAGLLHDIGKYSDGFQRRILYGGPRVDHSTAGAVEAHKILPKGLLQYILPIIISGHHTGLLDYGTPADTGDTASVWGRLKKSVEPYNQYANEVQLDFVPAINDRHLASIKQFWCRNRKEDVLYTNFLTRMLFSCLVDADYLDTERFMKHGQVNRGSELSMESLKQKFDQYIQSHGFEVSKNLTTVNGHRSVILQNCRQMGKGSGGTCFRFTSPTGSGKTLSSLGFALEKAVKENLERIIVVIPYTSIIEQTAAVYKSIFGENAVLEHHSNADLAEQDECSAASLAAENWDYPIVVTTNVQFFESFYHNRSSRCRKLHNVANSMLVFDEVQMLPEDYLKPCLETLHQLTAYYGTNMVLCSATQPDFDEFLLLKNPLVEICPDPEGENGFFRRVTYAVDGDVDMGGLARKLAKERQVLCIVNKRKTAQELYDKLGDQEGVYHLSTTLYPVHRKRIIAEIKRLLKDDLPVMVIATSLVECGVDFDFETVYRQMNGIDSIVQAAGRCNREGKRSKEESVVHIFDLDEDRTLTRPAVIARGLLEQDGEADTPEVVASYFRSLYKFSPHQLDKKQILNRLQSAAPDFAAIANDFRMIENYGFDLLIPFEEEAEQLYSQLRQFGPEKRRMRRLQQYVVNIPPNAFKKYKEQGRIQEIDGWENCWVLNDKGLYNENRGLLLDAEEPLLLY